MDPETYRDVVAPRLMKQFMQDGRGINLVRHHIESYNHFIGHTMSQIVSAFNDLDINLDYSENLQTHRHKLTIRFDNVRLSRPTVVEKDGTRSVITPQEARLRSLCYCAAVYADMHVTGSSSDQSDSRPETKILQNVCIGKVPIMVKSRYCVLQNMVVLGSGECRYDHGGYFIVNGNEKLVIAHDRITENQTFVFDNVKSNMTYSHIAEVRSVGWPSDGGAGTVKSLVLRISARPNQFGHYIRVALPHSKQDVPIIVLFRALGMESDRQILENIAIGPQPDENNAIMEYMMGSIAEASHVWSTNDALNIVGKHINIEYDAKTEVVKNVIMRDILPHTGKDFSAKAMYLGYMVRRLIRCKMGADECDDRDSYINKRVDATGSLMASLFRVHYSRMIKDMRNSIAKEVLSGVWRSSGSLISVINSINVAKHVKSNFIESGMKYALATGNWNVKGSMSQSKTSRKQGVAQVLNRLTYVATLSHLRRVVTPMEKNGKMVQPRKLHNTQWGIMCPSECFDPETPILMWDGSVKPAKEIVVGDHLIDDAGNAVRVKSTCSGFKTMYEVAPDKKNFMRHTVTDNHILTLRVKKYKSIKTRRGNKEVSWFDKKELRYRYKYFHDEHDLHEFYSSLDDDNVIDITIEQYLSLSKYIQDRLCIFKSNGINWSRKEVVMDPYILGMWLGDGLSTGCGFATADEELLQKWIEWGSENDATITPCKCKFTYSISSTINRTSFKRTEKAPLIKVLKKYDLVNNKHIPKEYLINDRETRLALLAGLIDTDGHVRANGHDIRICQGEKNYQIIYDAEFLARSLGFSCHLSDGICTYTVKGEKRQRPYKELYITGPQIHEIPTVLPRKKLNKLPDTVREHKSYGFLQSSFKLVKKDVQPFVGWQLEGNGRFLLGDMTISHNTPEGSSVGLVKNMALMAGITVHSDPWIVMRHFDDLGVSEEATGALVMINGRIVGRHEDPVKLVSDIRKLRRMCIINVYTSVYFDAVQHVVQINTEAGRFVRPLLVVNDTHDGLRFSPDDNLSWWRMVFEGHIEYLDVAESNHAMIALNIEQLTKGVRRALHALQYTHMEIDPVSILGVPASCIPFSDHNQAPRNTYQSSMCKQAIGINMSNFNYRFDTVNHILHYPQRALVQTEVARLLNCDKLPNGINCMAAIMTFTGYNMEDSLLINRAAIQRGMFVSTMYKTFREQNNRNHANGEEEYFCKPDPAYTRNMKPFNYDLLASDGFVPENTVVHDGDVIIGRCMPQKLGTDLLFRDNSVALKGTDVAVIDRNCNNDNYFTTTNGDGYTFAKTRIRCVMDPCVGDKFSSRHAQKGTCGMVFDDWDLPWTSDGVVPDVIMNTHAIPSRMTIAQLIEGVLAKAACVKGVCGQGGAFQQGDFRHVEHVLQEAGLQSQGNELVFDPRTGLQMQGDAFITPTYYQRLKHLSGQKVHSRGANGPVVLLTRQPTEGRSREGALRQGNMETHVLIAHGIMQFLKERMMECSDNFRVFVCNSCGNFADVNADHGAYKCRACSAASDFSEVRLPYSCKLLCQEMQALGIGTCFST